MHIYILINMKRFEGAYFEIEGNLAHPDPPNRALRGVPRIKL
jgi:hypothetical protein